MDHLGKALYEYGAMSEKTSVPLLRLPVPQNKNPSTISYHELGRVLDRFVADLARAEATLAGIKDDNVKLRLRLAKISFDFTGTGKNQTTLIELLTKLNGGSFTFLMSNPEFRIHFDRGDVAWLRAYCHLLSAIVEIRQAVDPEAQFESWAKRIFPNVEAPARKADPNGFNDVVITDAPRLRRMRLHLVAVCELNKETWKHIRNETDDDYEWLSHPAQTDQLGLPLTNAQIDGWLAAIAELEGLLKGELLVPGNILSLLFFGHDGSKALNVKKLFDDPPPSISIDRIQDKGIDAKYLEDHKGKRMINVTTLVGAFQLFDGPFSFAYAARLN